MSGETKQGDAYDACQKWKRLRGLGPEDDAVGFYAGWNRGRAAVEADLADARAALAEERQRVAELEELVDDLAQVPHPDADTEPLRARARTLCIARHRARRDGGET